MAFLFLTENLLQKFDRKFRLFEHNKPSFPSSDRPASSWRETSWRVRQLKQDTNWLIAFYHKKLKQINLYNLNQHLLVDTDLLSGPSNLTSDYSSSWTLLTVRNLLLLTWSTSYKFYFSTDADKTVFRPCFPTYWNLDEQLRVQYCQVWPLSPCATVMGKTIDHKQYKKY